MEISHHTPLELILTTRKPQWRPFRTLTDSHVHLTMNLPKEAPRELSTNYPSATKFQIPPYYNTDHNVTVLQWLTGIIPEPCKGYFDTI